MKYKAIPIQDHEEAVSRGIEIGMRLAKFEATTPLEFFKIELHGDEKRKKTTDFGPK